MSFVEGIISPQASQMCCDTPLLFGKDIHISIFRFIFRGDDGDDEELGGRN